MSKSILSVLSGEGLVVRAANGAIDEGATAAAVVARLREEAVMSAHLDGAISACLDTLFDRIPAGTSLPTPMVVQTVTAEITGGNLAQYVEVSKKVEAFLDTCPRFESKRGRSGGLRRLSK